MNNQFPAQETNATKEQHAIMFELIKNMQLKKNLSFKNPAFDRFQDAIISKITSSALQCELVENKTEISTELLQQIKNKFPKQ